MDNKLSCFMEGVEARAANKPNHECPYRINTNEHIWWNNGWIKYNEFLRDCVFLRDGV